jgi:hypothetical protein
MLKSLETKSHKLFLIASIATIVITTGAILALGHLVDRKLESVMILHDFFTVVFVMTGAGFVGILLFGSITGNNNLTNNRGTVNLMRILSILAAASVFLVIFTGIIGYVYYRLPIPDSPKTIIKNTFPYAHDVMFETMEYLGLIGTVWATLIAYLTHHFKDKIFTNSLIKNGLVMLISIGIVYALIISLAGIVPTKIASVQG